MQDTKLHTEGVIKVRWWKNKPSGRAGETGTSDGVSYRGLSDAPSDVLANLANAIGDELGGRAPMGSKRAVFDDMPPVIKEDGADRMGAAQVG